MLILDKSKKFQIKINCGRGTNTCDELLAFWVLLWVAQLFQISNLQVLRDSKVIIDWATNKSCLQVLSLEPWKMKIRELLLGSLQVDIQHTYKEYNEEADLLSKRALLLEEGKNISKCI